MKNIKFSYISIALLLLLFVGKSNAQDIMEFDVDGIKVIYKQVPKEIVSARFFVSGGTANYSVEQQGIENFAFNLAVSGGTKSMDKLAFSSNLEQMGSVISAATDYDYGYFNLICVKEHWDNSWNLFSDAIVNPSFNEQEFGLLKEQLIAGAKQMEADADESLRIAAMQNVFAGMNYAKVYNGTPESLESLSLEDLTNYYAKTVGKKRSFLVVIGDIDKKDLTAKIKASLAKLPEGTESTKEERIMLTDVKNKVIERDIATNYIRGYMSAPLASDDDGPAMMIAMAILYDHYWTELRTKRSLSYAPSAAYAGSIINNPYNYIYISTTNPKEAIKVMVEELKKVKKDGFTEEELINKQASYLTRYYMGQETLSSQSNSLGVAELKGGWEMSQDFTADVNAVTLEDINRVINKYTDVISWTYLGDAEQISEEDFLQPVDLSKKMKGDSEMQKAAE